MYHTLDCKTSAVGCYYVSSDFSSSSETRRAATVDV